MKEFTKSLLSAGISTAVFSARQAGVILTRPPSSEGPHPATDAFNALAQSAADQCGNGLRETINTMDKIQRNAIDSVFRNVSLDNMNQSNNAEAAANVFGQAANQMQSWFNEGCGCERESDEVSDFDRECNEQ